MAHYYDRKPDIESKRRLINHRFNGMDFEFLTDSGVFSKADIDYGSQLLIETLCRDLKGNGYNGKSFLDLGCGYGPVGIIAKRVFKDLVVTQVDVNERAIELSKENAELNSCPIKHIIQSNVLENIDDGLMFDIVATNPPVRAGKNVVFSFYEQALKHMNRGAVIYVVLQRKQGAPSTEKKLIELFGNCETLEKSGGYHIMKAVLEE